MTNKHAADFDRGYAFARESVALVVAEIEGRKSAAYLKGIRAAIEERLEALDKEIVKAMQERR